jgi:S-DNA-T family DNA segregation ATPase FtsK/SpoIIIE
MLMMRSRDKVLIPRIMVAPAANGLTVRVKTVGQVGLDEFERAADHLANAWKVRYVEAAPGKPGYLRLRITLKDALRTRTTLIPSIDAPVDLRSWALGIGRDGDPVSIRTADISGIAVGGLSGYGKTSLVYQRFVTLAPSALVQFALIDGKDFELTDLKDRAYLHCGDDITDAHHIVTEVYALYTDRKNAIRSVLHRRNFWAADPTLAWPLTVLIMDEAHTFLHETKFKDKTSQDRDNLVREMVRMIGELVRKGRTVGIQVMLLTQKPTGEAIPTAIRDNCQVAMSFAQRSKEAAVAALGEDINDYPHAHPRRLQDPAYIGVLSVMAEGRPGYTLARIPYVTDRDAIDLAAATAHLTRDPRALLAAALAPADALPV